MKKDCKSTQGLQASHTKKCIKERLQRQKQYSHLRDFIYGAVDGTVTTFAIVSGVAGAGLSPLIIIILGLANLFGDGFSMAVGNFLGTRAQKEQWEKARKEEEFHVDHIPQGEKEEIRQIYANKGFSGEILEKIVEVITSNRKLWINTMLQEELGLAKDTPSPVKAAVTTFIAFVLVGFLPLISFILHHLSPSLISHPFTFSTIITAIGFFIIGTFKSFYVEKGWFFAGLETLLLGGGAAAIAYFIGLSLKNLSY